MYRCGELTIKGQKRGLGCLCIYCTEVENWRLNSEKRVFGFEEKIIFFSVRVRCSIFRKMAFLG